MSARVRIAELNPKCPLHFCLVPDSDQLQDIAGALGLHGLRKLRLEGTLSARGKTDWLLSAHLGATVIQPCIVTLEPVTTRIEEPVIRLYLADWQDPEESEVEMPEDDSTEQLPVEINLRDVVLEALALALPPYPRAKGAALGETVYTEPGTAPLTDQAVKPFAGLAELKKKLEGGA